ncbi:hypothetical protein JCM10450v2_005631 [Rhodotorula kratochvilovae]
MQSLRPLLLPTLRHTTLAAPRARLPSLPPSALCWPLPRRALHASPLRREHSPQVPLNAAQGTPIGRLDRRLQITFTCTASLATDEDPDRGACGHRSSHEFSKRSYDRGVVIVQCPGCQNRHLIADHLHWFSTTPSPSHPTGQPFGAERGRTVEDLLREKGESARWGAPAGGGQARWMVSEHEEGDGGRTVEVLPSEEEGEGEAARGEKEKEVRPEEEDEEIRTLPVQ